MPIVDVSRHIDRIARNPVCKVDAFDAVVDSNTFTKLNGGTSLQQRTIPMPHSKLRRVWLVPQLSADNNGNGTITKLDAPFSPFSMNPVWSSPLSLTDIQVFVGGEALYSQPITQNGNYMKYSKNNAVIKLMVIQSILYIVQGNIRWQIILKHQFIASIF